jgi:hypothetical protein
MSISDAERAGRQAALEFSHASQRIDGPDISPDVLTGVQVWRGLMTPDEIQARILARVQTNGFTGL